MGYYPISGRDKLREAYTRLREQLADGAVALDRFVGWQGGGGRFEIYWWPDHRYWVLPSDTQEESRYWICVGLEDPNQYDNLTITCEINPSKDGSKAGALPRAHREGRRGTQGHREGRLLEVVRRDPAPDPRRGWSSRRPDHPRTHRRSRADRLHR